MGIPRLRIVFRNIGHRFVPFAGIDKAVIPVPAFIAAAQYGRSAVPGDIGNLPAIPLAFGIGEILRFLVSVVQAGIEGNLPELETGLYRHVDAAYLHVPEVDHRPLELIGCGHGDDLVVHLIEITVHRYVQISQPVTTERFVVNDPHVVLGRKLGLQLFVADERIIQGR